MKQFIQDLNNGLREFSEHPIEYPLSTIKDFAKDYWDLGAMVLAGFAFNDHGSEVFGDTRFPVMLASGLIGLGGAGEDTNRAFRNLYAGFASFCGFWTRGLDVPLSSELGSYGVTTLMSAASLSLDRERRRRQFVCSEDDQILETLAS